MAGNEPFIARWSRRKLEEPHDDAPAPEERHEAPEQPESGDTGGGETGGDDGAMTPEEEAQLRELEQVDIDSLTYEDDFSRFLQKKVPAVLKRRALRKLWTTHPIFAHRDGLNDYDTDFTDKATVVENLKSSWIPGRGYAPEEPAEQETPPAPDAEETPEAVASVDEAEEEQAEPAAPGDEDDAPGTADDDPDQTDTDRQA